MMFPTPFSLLNLRLYLLVFAIILVLLICFGVAPHSAAAQVGPPQDADPIAGFETYQTRCANCHGPLGMGDGELAANLASEVPAIGGSEYLSTADPINMFSVISNGNIAAGMPGFGVGNNSTPLSEDEIWDVVATIYSLELLSQPVEQAEISGTVVNGSTGETLTGGDILMQAITPQFEEGGRFETAINADGSYLFDLTNLPPNWFYRVVVNYQGFDFPSDFVALNGLQTEAELPVVVYDTTSDPSNIRVDRLQVLVDFRPDQVQIAEWYYFGSNGSAIFVGESGNINNGTVELNVPDGAQGVLFLRGFGGVADFSPISDLVSDGQIYRPKLAVYPGPESLQILVRYFLPYEAGMTVSHQLPYPVDAVDISLPVSGASIGGLVQGQPWLLVEDRQFGDEMATRQSFEQFDLQPDQDLSFTIEGFPTYFFDADGNQIINRNRTRELWIGIIVLAVVLIAGAGLTYQWRTAEPALGDRDDLIRRLAALDIAFEEKSINKRTYQNRRSRLKTRLKEIWE